MLKLRKVIVLGQQKVDFGAPSRVREGDDRLVK